MGVPLIDRSSKPVALTEAGELLLVSAEQISRDIYCARNRCQVVGRSAREVISFSALHTLSTTFFPGWIGKMEQEMGALQTKLVPHSFRRL